MIVDNWDIDELDNGIGNDDDLIEPVSEPASEPASEPDSEETIEDVGINDKTVPSRVSINQLSTPTDMPKIPEEDAPNINSVEVDNPIISI